MKFVIKLFPEITIKSTSVRKQMTKVLRQNLQNLFRRHSISADVQNRWDSLVVVVNADDEATRRQLERGRRVVELLKQPQYAPLKTWEMALALFAINNGYLDDVEVSNVLPFEVSLRQFMQTSHKDLIDRIEQTYELSKDDEPKLHEAVKSFKKTGAY